MKTFAIFAHCLRMFTHVEHVCTYSAQTQNVFVQRLREFVLVCAGFRTGQLADESGDVIAWSAADPSGAGYAGVITWSRGWSAS